MLFFTSQSIFDNDLPDLSDLVGLCLSSISGLKIQDLFHSILRKNVVASPDPFRESQSPHELANGIEFNVRIRAASQDTGKQFLMLGHSVVSLKEDSYQASHWQQASSRRSLQSKR